MLVLAQKTFLQFKESGIMFCQEIVCVLLRLECIVVTCFPRKKL